MLWSEVRFPNCFALTYVAISFIVKIIISISSSFSVFTLANIFFSVKKHFILCEKVWISFASFTWSNIHLILKNLEVSGTRSRSHKTENSLLFAFWQAVWFYPWFLSNTVSGSWPSKTYLAPFPDSGLNLDQSWIAISAISETLLSQHIIGRTDCSLKVLCLSWCPNPHTRSLAWLHKISLHTLHY